MTFGVLVFLLLVVFYLACCRRSKVKKEETAGKDKNEAKPGSSSRREKID